MCVCGGGGGGAEGGGSGRCVEEGKRAYHTDATQDKLMNVYQSGVRKHSEVSRCVGVSV